MVSAPARAARTAPLGALANVPPTPPLIGPDGALPLPWLAGPLAAALSFRHAHALLVQGPAGVGQFELVMMLAQSWLCEAEPTGSSHLACGRCAGCRLVQAHSHPDLLVLLPESLRDALGYGSADDAAGAESPGERSGGSSTKRKPSKDIRVDEVRQAIAFAQTSSARGRAKVVVMHPAERMNGISANALLKTLEEPPGSARLVLACAAPHALLPTIRSRCQSVVLGLPDAATAEAWLADRGVAQPGVMLAAAGGQPLDALAGAQDGIDAALWLALPKHVARGDAAPLSGWPLPRLIEMLQKLCHDALCVAAGAAPRYFPAASLPPAADAAALSAWWRELARSARHAEHPWNAALMNESLVAAAREALAPAARAPGRLRARSRGDSLHSAG